jgi:hypothetical protein
MKKSRKTSRQKSVKSDARKNSPQDAVKLDQSTAEPTAKAVVTTTDASPKPQKTYRMQLVAGRLDEVAAREIVGMWVSGGILSPEEADRRVKEVVIALKTESGAVVGVTTAYPVQVPKVGVCWFLRMFLLPEHRGFLGKNGLGLPSRMLGATMAFLAERSAAIPQNRPAGVVMVLENKKFQTPRWKKTFERNGWQYAGMAPNGCPALFRPFIYHTPEGAAGGENK